MEEIKHHGILGQKWGVKNGPPYPLGGGDYTAREKNQIRLQKRLGNPVYNKRHFDSVLTKKDTLSTLSYDKDRTKDTDMFYAAYKPLDKHTYNVLFNRKISSPVYDENGNNIGTGDYLKYKIDNKVTSDIKIASEDSGAEVFSELYKKDRDFYNFVTDQERMQNYFVDSKYKFKGYREAREELEKLRTGSTPSQDELQIVYRMFNYVIPYDGGGTDARGGRDVVRQRAKFFNALKNKGYGAVLDTNDSIYNHLGVNAIIVFDQKNLVLGDIKRTTPISKRVSTLAFIGRKFLNV